MRLYSLYRYYI